jgi:hypothetical protein
VDALGTDDTGKSGVVVVVIIVRCRNPSLPSKLKSFYSETEIFQSMSEVL